MAEPYTKVSMEHLFISDRLMEVQRGTKMEFSFRVWISTNYAHFGGDEYAWGTPHGDTIYFVVGGPYSDMYLMQSNDNGDNWTKTVILTNANKNLKVVPTYKAPWYSSDGSLACEMGKNGVVHVLSGIGGGEIQSLPNTSYRTAMD